MRKLLTIAAALVAVTTAAQASEYGRVYRHDGETTRIQCHRVYGCTITTAPSPSNNPRVIAIPEDMQRNTSDTWGGGCPSCLDLQRPATSATFEAGR